MAVASVKAKINGTTYNLTYNSSTGAWEGQATSPSKSSFNQTGGYYGIEITAYDDSGNSTTINASDSNFGDILKLYVKEKTAPTITVSSPTNNAVLTNNTPTFSWKVADADSGVKADSIKLYIDGTEVAGKITATKSGTTYTCSYVPTSALKDGSHTIKYAVTDNDGNSKTASITIKIDTVAPSLTVSTPENNAKVNTTPITVSGYTNDLTSSPVTVKVNGTSVTVDSNGYFTTTVALSSGDNKITIVATDGAGKSTTVTRTVNFNNNPPVFQSVSIEPNPVDAGATFKISVKVTDS